MFLFVVFPSYVKCVFRFCSKPPPVAKMMVSGVASNPQSIGSSALTATPIARKLIFNKMQNVCERLPKVRNLTHSPSKWSIDLKHPTNALTKIAVFDIHLPQSSMFRNADCAYLVPGNLIIR